MTNQLKATPETTKPADFADSPDIQAQLDWQKHQFDPYYYTGGRVHPFLLNPARPFWVGIVLLLAGLGTLAGLLWPLIAGQTPDELSDPNLLSLAPVFLIALALLLAAVGMFRRASLASRAKRRRHPHASR